MLLVRRVASVASSGSISSSSEGCSAAAVMPCTICVIVGITRSSGLAR
jgi:hypothetical protein